MQGEHRTTPNPTDKNAFTKLASVERGTQSFVYTMSKCWRQPSLTALEVLWRWTYGVPALGAIWFLLVPIVMKASVDWAGLKRMSLLDPLGAASALGAIIATVAPPVLSVMRWLGPLLLGGWILVSSWGRTLVLQRADRHLQSRPWTMVGLQAIRMSALLASFWVWFRLLEEAAKFAIVRNIAGGEEPNLVLCCALTIVITLGSFVGWAIASWALSVAPLLAMLSGFGVVGSLRAALGVGRLKGKLVEINLVMGIVKIALIVLAMVFSATPLPFESVTTETFLSWWWAAVTVIFFVASDFFHVVRLVAYLDQWRTQEDPAGDIR